MKKKILCMTLLLTFLATTSVQAAESTEGIEGAHNDAISVMVPDEEIPELEKSITNSNTYSMRDYSLYEPNDSIGFAYPYSSVSKFKCDHDENSAYGHYNCFYSANYTQTPGDLDFFSVDTNVGERYAIVLKNVWSDQIRDIRLYYMKDSGEWWYWSARNKIDGQTILHITAETNRYYIRISGEPAPGYTHSSTFNWFAMARDGYIDERPLVGSKKPYCSLQ